MDQIKKIILLLCLGLITINISSAKNNKKFAQLVNQKKAVSKIADKLKKLERKLADKNSKFLKIIRKRKSYDIDMDLLLGEIELEKEKLDKIRESQQNMVYKVFLLRESDFKGDPIQSLMDKTLQTEIKIQFTVAKTSIAKIQHEISEQLKLKKSIKDLNRMGISIESSIKEMEEEKQYYAASYLKAINEKDRLFIKSKKRKLKERSKVVNKKLFDSPVKEYLDIKSKSKGVTYKIKGTIPIYATNSGKLLYAGRLSTYGNLIIIDHGNSYRSVLLGDFISKLKKNKQVSKGDIIGYSNLNVVQKGKVYFEVRRNNKVKRTMNLINKRTLSSNSIIDKKTI